ncbi:MAG: hypothetical protein ABJG15_17435 [Hyphomonadaceae bacterium]
MMWSKLKQMTEERFVPELQGRVQVFQTVYRKSNDEEGEFWFSLDKKKLFSCGSMSFFAAERNETERLRSSTEDLSPHELQVRARETLMKQGMMTVGDFNGLLRSSLNLSVDAMLEHDCPLIRGLALIDSRLGRRRLEQMSVSGEHEFVSQMHSTRRAAKRGEI